MSSFSVVTHCFFEAGLSHVNDSFSFDVFTWVMTDDGEKVGEGGGGRRGENAPKRQQEECASLTNQRTWMANAFWSTPASMMSITRTSLRRNLPRKVIGLLGGNK